MSKTGILLASLVVNAALATVVALRQADPPPKHVEVVDAKPIVKTRVEKVFLPGETETVTNWTKLDWRVIESDDYVKYITNLRTAGCPEETIRDLIVADVNKMYAARWRTLHAGEHEFKYWENESKKERKEDRKTDERRELEKERDELIRTLLGVDLKSEMAKYSWDAERNSKDARLAFLTEDKQNQVKDLNDRYKDEMRKLMEDGKNANLSKEEMTARAGALRKQHEQDLAGMLSPGELIEYQLRNSSLSSRLRNDMVGFEPTEAEFRSMFQTLKPYSDQAMNSGEKFSLENNPELASLMQKTLSPERYAEWQQTQEPAYRDALKMAEKYQLNAEDTKMLAQINLTSETEIAKALANPNLTPEQRQAVTRAIKDEKKKVLSETLGKRVKRKN